MLRKLLIDWPARAMDLAGEGYSLFISAGSLVCLVTVCLILVLYVFGIRFGW